MTVRRGNGFGYQNTSIIAIGILGDYAPPLFCGRGGIVQERNQLVRLMVPVVPHVLLELWPAHLEIEEVVPRPVAGAVRPLTSLPALLLSLWTQSETAAGTGFLHPAPENQLSVAGAHNLPLSNVHHPKWLLHSYDWITSPCSGVNLPQQDVL